MRPILLDRFGRPLRLGEKLGEGGEGAVFRLQDHPSTAAKLYAAPLAAEQVRKIDELVRLGGHNGVAAVAAWPSGLVFDRAGTAVGLLLPVIERARDIHHLYTPSSRQKTFPNADWRFLVHVASNVARAFATVHRLGLVIGDVNSGSVLVAADGTVHLIDVDSFQVPLPNGQVLRCHVAVPMFQPPELQGAQLTRVVRTADHDVFGLAVIIFQLLMQGRHPFAGRYSGPGDMPIEKAIVEHRFAYGASASAVGMTRPPHSVGLDVLPVRVANLFEAAFARSAVRADRASAATWVSALDSMRAELARCRHNDSHFHSRHVTRCPWCALERESGAVLFRVPQLRSTRVLDAERNQFVARLAALPAPTAVPAPAEPSTRPQAALGAVEAAGIPVGVRVGYGVAALLVVVGLVIMPAGFVLLLFAAITGALAWGAVRKRRKPFRLAVAQAKTASAAASAEFAAANTFPRYHAAQRQAEAGRAKLASLPGLRSARMSQLQADRRKEQLAAMLNSRLIEDAKISGIGPGRAANLAAYGITTALHVTPSTIMQVPGFGEVLADRITGWRRGLERSFVFDPTKPIPPAAIARVDRELADIQQNALRDLRDALGRMEAAIRDEPARAEAAAVRLGDAWRRLAQAEADMAAANGRPARAH